MTTNLCLWDKNKYKSREEERKSSKDEINNAIAERCIENWEELRDAECRDPVEGERPGLSCADGIWANKLAGKNEGNGSESKAEAGNEEDDCDGG